MIIDGSRSPDNSRRVAAPVDGNNLQNINISSDGRLDRLVDEAIERRVSPSLICVVGGADGVYYSRAAGFSRAFADDKPCFDVIPEALGGEGSTAATFHTMYDMASLSKLLGTTMAALRLLEEGRLTLIDNITMYFDDVPQDKRYIDIKMLMTHTSGISAHFRLDHIDCVTPDGAARAIIEHPLAYTPGTKVEYSCMGYILLAKILEKIEGEPLDAITRRLVFEPLGMNRTCYNPIARGETDFAVTEFDEKLGRYINGVVHDENARFLGGVSGNAGVFSCAGDLVRFASMLSSHGGLPKTAEGDTDAGRFLSRVTFDMALRDYTSKIDAEQVRGLGFQLRGHDEEVSAMGDLYSDGSYGHNGFTGPSLYVDRETGLYSIILANRVHFTRESARIFRFRRQFHNAALSEFK
ncbi:MAG: serine hydrolase domain-containing protein [Eubacteriales bacterium]